MTFRHLEGNERIKILKIKEEKTNLIESVSLNIPVSPIIIYLNK